MFEHFLIVELSPTHTYVWVSVGKVGDLSSETYEVYCKFLGTFPAKAKGVLWSKRWPVDPTRTNNFSTEIVIGDYKATLDVERFGNRFSVTLHPRK